MANYNAALREPRIGICLHYDASASDKGAVGAVLRTERSQMFDPHYVEFLAGLGERLAEREIDIVLGTAKSGEELASYSRISSGKRVDALILSSPVIRDERIHLLNKLRMPFILHGRTISEEPHAWLDIDNEGGFRHATNHLLDLGHTRIALINGAARYTYAAARERGFRAAMAARGLPADESLIGEGIMTDEVGYRFAEQFLNQRPRPTAILVSSMMMALGAFRAIRSAGLTLGKDVSMISHDDVFPFLNADRMVPTMSTTRSSIRAAGVRVGELAIELMAGRKPETIHELWPVDLIVRASTGPAPA